MSLETDLVTLLQAQCPRVFPSGAPVNTTRPFVTWEHIGGDPLRYIEGTAATQKLAILGISVFSSSKSEAMSLAAAIETAICTSTAFSGRPSNGLPRGDHSDDVEPAIYWTTQEFEVLGAR